MTLPPRLHAYATRLLIGTILAVEQPRPTSARTRTIPA